MNPFLLWIVIFIASVAMMIWNAVNMDAHGKALVEIERAGFASSR